MISKGKILLDAISRERLEKCIDENSSLRGFLQGYIAEEKLRDYLESILGVSDVSKIPDQDSIKGDFRFCYGGTFYTLELKSVRSSGVKEDQMEGGSSGCVVLKTTDSRTLKNGSKTYCLNRNEFDILAISTFAIDGNWDFKFILNKYIPSSETDQALLVNRLWINTENTPLLRSSILDVLADIG